MQWKPNKMLNFKVWKTDKIQWKWCHVEILWAHLVSEFDKLAWSNENVKILGNQLVENRFA